MVLSLIMIVCALPPALITGRILLTPRNRHLFAWTPSLLRRNLPVLLFTLIAPVITITERLSAGFGSTVPSWSLLLLGTELLDAVILTRRTRLFQPHCDTSPLLIMTDKQGSYGLPDLALIFCTAGRTRHSLLIGDDGRRITGPGRTRSHTFLIRDLQPGKPISYRLEGTSGGGRVCVPAASMRIAVSSDAHIGAGSNEREATERILTTIAGSCDLFVDLGDTVQMGHDRRQQALASRIFFHCLGSTPVIPVPGNHDTWFGGETCWKEIFEPDAVSRLSASPPLTHHYRPFPTVDLITLDLEWGPELFSETIRQWLEEELKLIPDDHLLIIASHAFFFSSGRLLDSRVWYDPKSMIDTFHRLFVDYGVDLVLSGHNHQFEHLHKDGIDYLVTGTLGGSLPKQELTLSPTSVFLETGVFGFTELFLTADTCRVTFRDAEGREIYAFDRLSRSLPD